MVWGFETETHDIKQGPKEAFGLAKRQPEHLPKGERCLDGQVRILLRSSFASGRLCSPSLNRPGLDPQSDVTPLDEGLVVFGPVGDSILRLVHRVDSGLHALTIAGVRIWTEDTAVGPVRADQLCTNAGRKPGYFTGTAPQRYLRTGMLASH